MATPDPASPRSLLRQKLLAARKAWALTPALPRAQEQLQDRAWKVLAQLEPCCLGVYWPVAGEFNPRDLALMLKAHTGCGLALPWASRSPVEMHYRTWTGEEPDAVDECGIPSTQGKPVSPDVLLVPCVGFAAEGWRLGYGGGYFDRYLASHPDATAIGLAWDIGQIEAALLGPQSHDLPLLAVLTESAIFGG
jgi:5-formyltetrahydrofolate cyclo-ligase